MNKNTSMTKLKIRNRILAIAVAFFLLALMVPKMSFAMEPNVQPKDNASEEVNTTNSVVVSDTSSNAETINGAVYDAEETAVEGAIVSAYKDSKFIGRDTTSSDGSFTVECAETVMAQDHILLMVTTVDYAFEVVDTYAGAQNLEITLSEKAPVTIKPYTGEETHHASWGITTQVADCKSVETYDEEQIFQYSFPVGGKFMMTHNAHLLFSYENSFGQQVNVDIVGNGTDWYRSYFWGAQSTGSDPFLLEINKPYTLASGVDYTAALIYQGQGKIAFASDSKYHDNFHFVFNKNGQLIHDLKDVSLEQKTFVGTTCTLQEDGAIKMYYNDTDETYEYEVDATITAMPKDGYKVSNWTCNEKVLEVGKPVEVNLADTLNFKVNYVENTSGAAQTGDISYIWVVALTTLVLISAGTLLRFRRR